MNRVGLAVATALRAALIVARPKGLGGSIRRRRVAAALPAAFLVALVAGCDNPQPPASCGTVSERTVNVGETATVSVCFNDPNEDLLTFVATSSDPEVATVTNAANTVTVTAVSPGNAVVTVVATDPGGLTARQNFRVTVPNRPPATQGTIEDRELMVGDSVVLDVAAYFSEPDGQALGFAAASSDSTLVGAAVSGTTLTALARAKGTVVVTVTATDPGGLTANQRFQVTVPNRVPMAVDSISARIIEVDQVDTLDVSPYFADPDGDSLVYAAVTSDSTSAVPTVQGSVLTVTALAKGEIRITVTATDDEGAAAEQSFGVTVPNRAPVGTDSVPDLELFRGEADTIALAMHFADPDGDSLSFAATASDGNVVGVAVSAPDGTLTVAAVGQGSAEVTVTATDNEGASAQQMFRVTVPNRPPEATDSLPDLELFRGEADTIALAMHFADPDGDSLSYAATASNGDVVAVAVPDGTLTVTAVAQGGAEVTVTATDGAGASAEQSFGVTVPNRAPEATDSLPDLELFRGEADTVALAMHFADPDGDSLSYEATTSDGDAVAVAVSAPDGTLTVTAVAQGDAEIAVTATDGAGAVAEQSFAVTVPNRAPGFDEALPALTMFRRDTVELDLGQYFFDPDGDRLGYTAESTDNSVAVATVQHGTLTVRTTAETGAARINVTATDPGKLSAQQRFPVTVRNRAPVATAPIPDLTLAQGAARTLDASLHFEDLDGSVLKYTATSSNASAVRVSLADSIITVRAVGSGQAEVTVTATDIDEASAAQSFTVTVGQPSAGFDIVYGFDTSVGSTLRTAIENSLSYWASALRATEFPDVPVDSTLDCWGVRVTIEDQNIDDLAIVFLADSIDGAGGILAAAGACYVRSLSRTPLLGLVAFDEDDVGRLAQSGNLTETALHEIAHVLGIGSWHDGSLLRNPSAADSTADTHFAGARAVAAFNAAGGSGYTGAKVPVQAGGDDAHWRESVLGHEIMTPTVVLGTTSPLSAITLQALADLGYAVDVSYAEAYSLPAPAPAAAIADGREVLEFGDDLLRGPIQVVGPNGNVVDVVGVEAAPAGAGPRIRAGPAIRVIIGSER